MKKLPIFVALDLEDEKTALNYAEKCSPYVLGFKVGPRLYFHSGSSFLEELSRWGNVFLDFKFYDIPSTMEASVRTCFQKGAKYLTVHAEAGKEALSRVAQVEKDFQNCRVLAVTVLTSQKTILYPDETPASSSSQQSEDLLLKHILYLAQLTSESGLSGLVASPQEVHILREKYPDFFIVTPGIRLNAIEGDDQKRMASPSYALSKGASALVIGRPILKAEDPLQVFKMISESLE